MIRQMTREDVKQLANKLGGRPIYTVGFGDWQKHANSIIESHKVGYNAGVYGWNYDIYGCIKCVIITGYRPNLAKKIAPVKTIDALASEGYF